VTPSQAVQAAVAEVTYLLVRSRCLARDRHFCLSISPISSSDLITHFEEKSTAAATL